MTGVNHIPQAAFYQLTLQVTLETRQARCASRAKALMQQVARCLAWLLGSCFAGHRQCFCMCARIHMHVCIMLRLLRFVFILCTFYFTFCFTFVNKNRTCSFADLTFRQLWPQRLYHVPMHCPALWQGSPRTRQHCRFCRGFVHNETRSTRFTYLCALCVPTDRSVQLFACECYLCSITCQQKAKAKLKALLYKKLQIILAKKQGVAAARGHCMQQRWLLYFFARWFCTAVAWYWLLRSLGPTTVWLRAWAVSPLSFATPQFNWLLNFFFDFLTDFWFHFKRINKARKVVAPIEGWQKLRFIGFF